MAAMTNAFQPVQVNRPLLVDLNSVPHARSSSIPLRAPLSIREELLKNRRAGPSALISPPISPNCLVIETALQLPNRSTRAKGSLCAPQSHGFPPTGKNRQWQPLPQSRAGVAGGRLRAQTRAGYRPDFRGGSRRLHRSDRARARNSSTKDAAMARGAIAAFRPADGAGGEADCASNRFPCFRTFGSTIAVTPSPTVTRRRSQT